MLLVVLNTWRPVQAQELRVVLNAIPPVQVPFPAGVGVVATVRSTEAEVETAELLLVVVGAVSYPAAPALLVAAVVVVLVLVDESTSYPAAPAVLVVVVEVELGGTATSYPLDPLSVPEEAMPPLGPGSTTALEGGIVGGAFADSVIVEVEVVDVAAVVVLASLTEPSVLAGAVEDELAGASINGTAAEGLSEATPLGATAAGGLSEATPLGATAAGGLSEATPLGATAPAAGCFH